MNLRDKIEDAILDNIEDRTGAEPWGSGRAADAILSVIAESVVPLDWEVECDFYCAELFECETDFGKYSAFLAAGRADYSWCLEDGPSAPEKHGFGSMDAAKAAAQADYTRRILSALGIRADQ